VVEVRPPVGLDVPPGPGPGLPGPTAERREVKVAGEPNVGWKERERERQRRERERGG